MYTPINVMIKLSYFGRAFPKSISSARSLAKKGALLFRNDAQKLCNLGFLDSSLILRNLKLISQRGLKRCNPGPDLELIALIFPIDYKK